MSFLKRLPHQIPFRAASRVRSAGEGTIEGDYVCTANDRTSPGLMAVEAMAQLAGSLVFERQASLVGIDDCEVLRRIAPGDVVRCRVTLEAGFGGTFRFQGAGFVDGDEAVRARIYLSGEEAGGKG